MKKIFTLAAAAMVGASAFGAAPMHANLVESSNYSLTPEGAQHLRTMQAQHAIKTKSDILNMGENVYTRNWATTGGEWMLMVTTEMEKLADILVFVDDQGKDFQYTFDELPYYVGDIQFYFFPTNSETYTRAVSYVAAWPTYYYYSQIFDEQTWDIPVDERNYDIVPPSKLFNQADYCHSFEECAGIGGNFDNDAGTWSYWMLLPNETFQWTSIYDGNECYTQIGSSLDFSAYDESDSFTEVTTRISLKAVEGARSYNMRIRYSGTARVQGFEHLDITLPEFGDLYLFNTGVTSSEILGEDTPFTEAFPETTQFYMFAADKLFNVWLDPAGGAFNPDKIQPNGLNVDTEAETAGHLNMVRGYLWGEPKYGNDPTLNPEGVRYTLSNIHQEYDAATDKYYPACAPVMNSFVPYGYTYAWSMDMGMQVVMDGYYERMADDSALGWGTTQGLVLNLLSVYDKNITATSTGTVHYYYDPSDITKVRDFSTVGSAEWSGVENVVADGVAAQVYARDGKIFVNADEAADVAIFTLDGKLVKSVKAAEVAVEAAKGVYVVCVGNKASKVVL